MRWFTRKDQFSPAISNEQDLPYYLMQETLVCNWLISSEHAQIGCLSSRSPAISRWLGLHNNWIIVVSSCEVSAWLHIFTPPARRAWRSCKFAPFLFFFHLSMSKVGLPLMGDTAGFFLLFSALLHIIWTEFIAEYVNKTRILTCILKYLNENKVLRAKILTKGVLKRQILTDSIAKNYCFCRGKHIV